MLDCFSRGVLHFKPASILFFRTHAQGLVLACVVFAEERGQALIEFAHGLVATDIDVVILYRAPQTLDHDVVQGPSFAIHTDFNLMGFEHTCEGFTGELASIP